MAGYTVRLLGHDETDLFRRIRLEGLRREPAAFASSGADWEQLHDDEWRRRLTVGPVVAALRSGEPVGLMGLLPERGRRTAHRATLVMVYVRREERGAGLADRMLATLLAAAATIGLRQIELHVSAENPAALGFYRRAGFAEAGRLPAGFVHEGREVEEILMVRRLAAVNAPRGR
ncbi:MAG TPA: GNAT family N-acetyltransferase [Amaricoccus sp.]|nr:GNAT family N-acetyltransferase [Amaricoccus sp.]